MTATNSIRVVAFAFTGCPLLIGAGARDFNEGFLELDPDGNQRVIHKK